MQRNTLEQGGQEAWDVSSSRLGPEVAEPEARGNSSPYPQVSHHSPNGSPRTCTTSGGDISPKRVEWLAAAQEQGLGSGISIFVKIGSAFLTPSEAFLRPAEAVHGLHGCQ